MNDYPVKLGSILFTVVEPHRGHEVEYNRWYERDHFYAGCLVGPGILAGRRWVATRPYKDLRFLEPGVIAPDATAGSYLATYWIEKSRSAEWGAWGAREVHKLHADGRMFPHRDHVHTKMYAYDWGRFRDAHGVPAELALDHPFPGLVAVIGEATGERKDATAWFLDHPALSGALVMQLAFKPIPIPDSAPADIPRVPEDRKRFLHVYFVDRDPAEVWDAEFASIPKEIEGGGKARVLWMSPFIPTIPGTDTYTDKLW